MPRDINAKYDTRASDITDELRDADQFIVLAVKNGEPVLWSTDTEPKAQELLGKFFPSAVLPRQMADHG